MDMIPATYFDNLKRHWRRKKYQKLDHDSTTHGKKRPPMKVARLGSKTHRVFKLRSKVVLAPIKLLARFHGTMMRLVGAGDDEKVNSGLFGRKRIPKGRRAIPIVSASNKVVDRRLILELYKPGVFP
ncbi:hypothetical protein U1Q18_045183 [Sarracenia purpurea var. burkii]